jgi:hypothetical protein
MHNGRPFDRMPVRQSPAIAIQMARGRVRDDGGDPPHNPRVYGPRHGQIKMGSQTRDPITLQTFRPPSSFSWASARAFLLALPRPGRFRARRFFAPSVVFGRKPIDRGEPIRLRRCCDFRSRHDGFPCQPHDNLTDRIGSRFRSADGLRPDNARVKAGQFLFGQLARSFDVVVRVSLRSRGRMSVHQQIAEACYREGH